MDKELMIFLVSVFVFIVLTLSAYYFLERYACSTKWEESGFQSRFGIVSGCLVKQKDGRWIPSENYREF